MAIPNMKGWSEAQYDQYRERWLAAIKRRQSGMTRYRTYGYAYPSSAAAAALGHGATGCWYAGIVGNGRELPAQPYRTRESAIAGAAALYSDLEWWPMLAELELRHLAVRFRPIRPL